MVGPGITGCASETLTKAVLGTAGTSISVMGAAAQEVPQRVDSRGASNLADLLALVSSRPITSIPVVSEAAPEVSQCVDSPSATNLADLLALASPRRHPLISEDRSEEILREVREARRRLFSPFQFQRRELEPLLLDHPRRRVLSSRGAPPLVPPVLVPQKCIDQYVTYTRDELLRLGTPPPQERSVLARVADIEGKLRLAVLSGHVRQ